MTQTADDERAPSKRRAAERAAQLAESGMVVGLGAGSTAAFALAHLAARVQAGRLKDVVFVPCSETVAAQAQTRGLRVVTLADAPSIDLTIDGADEVDANLDLIKGRGGALLREKMVAQATRREVIVVDESKLSPRLGTLSPVPVEVFPFGWRAEERFLRELGAQPSLRTAGAEPFRTDQGNWILECAFGPLASPAELAAALEARAGIAAHGLFLGLATDLLVGDDADVRHVPRAQDSTPFQARAKEGAS